MAQFEEIRNIIDSTIIFCLIPMILTLPLVNLCWKEKYPIKKVLNIISWIIVSYTVINTIYFIIGLTFMPEKFAFLDRATGPYWWSYWIMFLSATILPFSLLIKKLRVKLWYVLLVSFCMKIGFYFERFTLTLVSFHRDYSPSNEMNTDLYLPFYNLGMVFLQGFIMVIVLLTILKIVDGRKPLK